MRSRRSFLITLTVCTVVATLGGLPPASGAVEPNHIVQAGAAQPPESPGVYEYTRYYPSVLAVHRGQIVRWNVVGDGVITGFHTITFSDAGRPAFIREDEIPGTFATPEAWSLGSACGRNGLDPCIYDEETTFLSSGIPPFGNSPFDVTIDVPVGTYGYFCTVHPAMAGTIRVVPRSQSLPDAGTIAQQVASDIEADTETADALWETRQDPVSTIEEGQRVWRVLVGDSTSDDHVSLLSYLPDSLAIDAGDKVRFVIPTPVVNEVHTVTFPGAATGGFSPIPHGLGGFGFYASCDPDDRMSGAKGVPGAWNINGPDCPANLELAISPWMTSPVRSPENLIATPVTMHDSGLMMPPGAPENFRTLPDGRLLPAVFEAIFPAPGDFAFECNVHVDPMSGVIRVA